MSAEKISIGWEMLKSQTIKWLKVMVLDMRCDNKWLSGLQRISLMPLAGKIIVVELSQHSGLNLHGHRLRRKSKQLLRYNQRVNISQNSRKNSPV